MKVTVVQYLSSDDISMLQWTCWTASEISAA